MRKWESAQEIQVLQKLHAGKVSSLDGDVLQNFPYVFSHKPHEQCMNPVWTKTHDVAGLYNARVNICRLLLQYFQCPFQSKRGCGFSKIIYKAKWEVHGHLKNVVIQCFYINRRRAILGARKSANFAHVPAILTAVIACRGEKKSTCMLIRKNTTGNTKMYEKWACKNKRIAQTRNRFKWSCLIEHTSTGGLNNIAFLFTLIKSPMQKHG